MARPFQIHRGPFQVPLEERIWAKVEKTATCWLWRAGLTTGGYAMICRSGEGGKPVLVHRWMYEHFTGPIAPGLQLDHLCRVRRCVNPAHLEVVTPQENNRRSESPSAKNAVKTHCKHGHEFTTENTYLDSEGSRLCRLCQSEAGRRFKTRLKAKGLTTHGTAPHVYKPKAVCNHGHAMTPENTTIRTKNGCAYRVCRRCLNERARERTKRLNGRAG
jgi:hypothetical protein